MTGILRCIEFDRWHELLSVLRSPLQPGEVQEKCFEGLSLNRSSRSKPGGAKQEAKCTEDECLRSGSTLPTRSFLLGGPAAIA